VDAVAVRAAIVVARLRERARHLVQRRLVHRARAPLAATVERDDGVLAAIVAASRLAAIAVAPRLLLRTATRLLPLGRLAQALARRGARRLRLLRGDVALREDVRRADRLHVVPLLERAVRCDRGAVVADEARLPAIDAECMFVRARGGD